ncbi:MAG: hypothetical protein SPL54_01735, partial [Lachnospiraceae bacterium]|nr:hypothetical protein [Lachnospiraceae bacterium]
MRGHSITSGLFSESFLKACPFSSFFSRRFSPDSFDPFSSPASFAEAFFSFGIHLHQYATNEFCVRIHAGKINGDSRSVAGMTKTAAKAA